MSRLIRTTRTVLLVLSLVFLLPGCAHDPSRPAMTGGSGAKPASVTATHGRNGKWKPEVSISGASKKAVLDALVQQMTSQGYSVSMANDYRLEFDKPAGAAASILSAAFMGRNLTDPVWRIAFNVVEVTGGVRVTADIAMMRNPGTAVQDRVDMNSGKNRDAVQRILDGVQNQTARVTVAPPDTSRSAR